MAYEWGKYINGEVFIEDPIIINNGNIISTEELENKENFNIKQIKYFLFPHLFSPASTLPSAQVLL